PERMRAVGMSVRIAPRKPRGPRNWNLPFQQLVVRLQVPIRDRPVRADAILRVDPKIRRMKSRSERRPVYGPAANAFAAVVFAQRKRVRAADDAKVVPIEFVRSLFVAHPVFLCVPERTGLKPNHAHACPRQPP